MYIETSKQPLRTIKMPKEYAYSMKFSYDEKKLLILCSQQHGQDRLTKIYIHTINEDQRSQVEYLDKSNIDSVAFCTDNIKFALCSGWSKSVYIRTLLDYSLIQQIKCDLFDRIDRQWISNQPITCIFQRSRLTLELDTWTDQKDLFKYVIIKQKKSSHFQIDIFDRISLRVRSNHSILTVITQIRQNNRINRIYCQKDLTKFFKHNNQQLYFLMDSRKNCQIINKNGKLVRFFRDIIKEILNSLNEWYQAVIQVFDQHLYLCFGSRVGKINITSGSFEWIDLFGNFNGRSSGCIAVSWQYQAISNGKILKIYEQ